MATSLQTTNYGFGKYAPDDVTSYLTDYNGTMDKIDGAIKGVADVANEAKATGDSNLNNIANLSQGLTATNKNVENLGKTQTAQQTEIDNLNSAVSNITVNDFSGYLFTSVHSNVAQVEGNMRAVGKGVQGGIVAYIDAATYTPDANVENTNVVNVARIAGNVFGMENMKRQTTVGVCLAENVIIDSPRYFSIYYNAATNYTYIAVIIGENTVFSKQTALVMVF